jgi:hypothetical protein
MLLSRLLEPTKQFRKIDAGRCARALRLTRSILEGIAGRLCRILHPPCRAILQPAHREGALLKPEALFTVTGLIGASAAANVLVTCRNAGKVSLAPVASQRVTAIRSNQIHMARRGRPSASSIAKFT